MRRSGMSKGPLRDEVGRLLRLGWTDETGKKHVKLRSPDGRLVILPSTPSDTRAWRNAVAKLRRVERGGNP